MDKLGKSGYLHIFELGSGTTILVFFEKDVNVATLPLFARGLARCHKGTSKPWLTGHTIYANGIKVRLATSEDIEMFIKTWRSAVTIESWIETVIGRRKLHADAKHMIREVAQKLHMAV